MLKVTKSINQMSRLNESHYISDSMARPTTSLIASLHDTVSISIGERDIFLYLQVRLQEQWLKIEGTRTDIAWLVSVINYLSNGGKTIIADMLDVKSDTTFPVEYIDIVDHGIWVGNNRSLAFRDVSGSFNRDTVRMKEIA